MAIPLFWFSIFILFYIYFGYPLLLWFWAKLFPRPVRVSQRFPTVSIVLSAFNEEKTIKEKLENLLSLNYPSEKLEIVVGSDGSTDRTASLLKQYEGKKVKVLIAHERGGKPRMLNRLVREARGEILVFTDARQKIASSGIRHLVKNFNDPVVGCVSGELLFGEINGTVGEGVNVYWRYETFIRSRESLIGSVIGATGALYAIRKSLYEPIPEETLLDDVFLPMKIISKGYRTLFDPEAKVYDDASFTPRQEYDRKVRTLAGNYQCFVQLSSMLNPLRSRVAFQFISHKLLRVLAPFFLLTLFLSNLFMLNIPLTRILFLLQSTFYGFALFGAIAPTRMRRIFSAPYVFCLLNVSAVMGLYRYLTGSQQVTWKTQ